MKKSYLIIIFLFIIFISANQFILRNEFDLGTVAKVSEQVSFEQVHTPNQLVIESLNIAAPVVYPGEISEKAFQQALQNGAVHYPGTALPGEYGNVYIFGHSSDDPWHKGDYKNVFEKLPQIEIGEEIMITDKDGNKFVYEVLETKIIFSNDISVLAQPADQRLLTLQTSYPVGTSQKRFVVIAELTQNSRP
jgi:LPXTG-site transpeptidase (sortase) family protein